MKTNIYDDRFDKVRDLIGSKIVELGAASLAVTVAQEGKILWEEGFGWANREKRVAANHHTIYSLASITKPITATGLMILKEQGKIDLDAPINSYLGEAKLKSWIGNADDATVRTIANHTSGLPLHCQFFYEDEPHRRPTMDETIRRYANIITTPGEKYQYSNLGYGILDYVISRISGKSYIDFMREEVFIPLGMTRASINIAKGLEKYQAIRYGNDGMALPFYDFDHPGGSAAFCSAHDLARFGMFHLKAHLSDQKAILSDDSIDEMQRGTALVGNESYYGVGWASKDDVRGYRIVWHNGGMGGVSTTLQLLPTEKIVVVVLSNTASYDSASDRMLPDLICMEILSAMLPKYAENYAKSIAKHGSADAKIDEKLTFPPTLLGEWSGNIHTYNGDIPVTFWFKTEDVHVKMGDQLKTLLNDAAYNDGHITGKMIGDIGTEDANRRPYHLHVSLNFSPDKAKDIINGAIAAIYLPNPRMGNALSHWIELKKIS